MCVIEEVSVCRILFYFLHSSKQIWTQELILKKTNFNYSLPLYIQRSMEMTEHF